MDYKFTDRPQKTSWTWTTKFTNRLQKVGHRLQSLLTSLITVIDNPLFLLQKSVVSAFLDYKSLQCLLFSLQQSVMSSF